MTLILATEGLYMFLLLVGMLLKLSIVVHIHMN